jgi:O-antigen/teichoic acid export membrane protein
MRQSHLILSNTLVIWVSRVLLVVPQVILVPYLIRTIGEEGYGVYVLIWSLLISVSDLEQSLQQGVVKYSAAFLAEKRIDEVNRVVSSSFVYSFFLAAVASLGIFVTTAFFPHLMGGLRTSLFVVGVLVLFMIPMTPYIAVIQSRQKYYIGVLADTLSRYVSLAVVVAWFTMLRPSVEALIVIMAAMLLFSRFAQVPVAYRMLPGLKNRPTSFDWRVFRLIVSFGGVVVFLGLCNIANTTGVRWLMGALVSTSFVAHLAIMIMPGALLSQITEAMTITIMPATSAYEATGNDHMLRELLLRSMRYTTIIALAALLIAAMLIKDMLTLWVGSSYTFLAPYTLAILATVALLMTTSSAHHMLKGLGKLWIVVFIALVGKVIVPLALIVSLFIFMHDPYLAVTTGLVAGNVVCVMMHLRFVMKVLHVSIREIITRVYKQPLIAVVIAGAPVFVLAKCGGVNAIVLRVSIAVLGNVAFLVLMYFIFATMDERRQAAEIAQGVWRRVADFTEPISGKIFKAVRGR